MTRKEILDAAKTCVCGDRDEDYGTPEDNFRTIAEFWNTYLESAHKDKVIICSEDVPAMMILLKIARAASGHGVSDNWIDICGYSSCAGELSST